MNISTMNMEERLQSVVVRAAALLPHEIGQQLLAFITPEALAAMAGITVVWIGAHFFGVGEAADIILLLVGWAAVGGVAIEAAKKLFDFINKTYQARSDDDLENAAHDLAQAITLIGVNTVMALLLKKKPSDTFQTTKGGVKVPRYSNTIASKMNLPRSGSPAWLYKPKITFTKRLNVSEGSTNIAGDIKVGRDVFRNAMSGQEARERMLMTLYHEQVHQFIAPKFYLFREFRSFMRQSGYLKSYLLRYLEEALAETVALMRARGLSSETIISGLKYPIAYTNNQITYTLMRHEAAGILLGPVVVGGLVYNVYYGLIND